MAKIHIIQRKAAGSSEREVQQTLTPRTRLMLLSICFPKAFPWHFKSGQGAQVMHVSRFTAFKEVSDA